MEFSTTAPSKSCTCTSTNKSRLKLEISCSRNSTKPAVERTKNVQLIVHLTQYVRNIAERTQERKESVQWKISVFSNFQFLFIVKYLREKQFFFQSLIIFQSVFIYVLQTMFWFEILQKNEIPLPCYRHQSMFSFMLRVWTSIVFTECTYKTVTFSKNEFSWYKHLSCSMFYPPKKKVIVHFVTTFYLCKLLLR